MWNKPKHRVSDTLMSEARTGLGILAGMQSILAKLDRAIEDGETETARGILRRVEGTLEPRAPHHHFGRSGVRARPKSRP